MEFKPKKCRGIGVAIKAIGCGQLKLGRKFGLCPKCYKEWLLNTPEGQKKIEAAKIKAVKKVKIEIDKKAKYDKQKWINANTDFKSKLQIKVNVIVRLLDAGLPCLAREKHANQMHAGHVYSRGSNPSMRYNLHNIHRQSAQSNHYQSDDLKMREGLIREYGQDYMDFVDQLKQTRPIKLTQDDYIKSFNIATHIEKTLKKENRTYSLEERIQKRNDINIKLNIYNYDKCIFNPRQDNIHNRGL